jgi:arsenate reductase
LDLGGGVELVVYGIPTCGTVKKARKWLDDRGATYRWVDLRADPPDRARVAGWVAAVGYAPLRNTSGGAYRALGAEKDGWSDAEWIDAYAADPMPTARSWPSGSPMVGPASRGATPSSRR